MLSAFKCLFSMGSEKLVFGRQFESSHSDNSPARNHVASRHMRQIAIFGVLCCFADNVNAQPLKPETVLQVIRTQWAIMGDCIEVRMKCKRNSDSIDMSAYRVKTLPISSGAFDSTCIFSGTNFRKAYSTVLVNSGYFQRTETARLNGDNERLTYDSDGRPVQGECDVVVGFE